MKLRAMPDNASAAMAPPAENLGLLGLQWYFEAKVPAVHPVN